MEQPKKITTSKIVVYMSVVTSFILSAIVVYCTFKGIDCSNLATITALAWAETAASNAAYFNKSKKENIPKIINGFYNQLPEELKKQVDINQLLTCFMN